MKKSILQLTGVLWMFILLSACDNGYSDVPVIDTPPTITLGAITSGLVEGQDFKIEVTLSDGKDEGRISTLSTFNYSISKTGVVVATGSEDLSGDLQKVIIEIPGGFEPGNFNLDILARDSNGNESTENLSFTVASARPAFDITGEWTMAPIPGAFAVGPAPGDGQWYTSTAGDVVTRACFFNDTFTFNADGSYTIKMGDQTWLETWQGVGADTCGTPVAPYNGGTFSYTYTSTAITLSGVGAFVGLPKVNNAGELPNVAVPSQITYTIVEQSEVGESRNMTLRIEAGSGVWWDFKLTSGTSPTVDIAGTWKMEPVEGAFSVGPSAGSQEFFFSKAGDVTTRACFFDDTYTFGEEGSFSIEMGDQTWLETWQGVAADGCGTPKAPHDGSGSYTYQYNGATLKLTGLGAHVALPKAVNAGELPNVAVPNDVTYQVASITESGGVKKMTLFIETGTGVWWTFKLISE